MDKRDGKLRVTITEAELKALFAAAFAQGMGLIAEMVERNIPEFSGLESRLEEEIPRWTNMLWERMFLPELQKMGIVDEEQAEIQILQ